MLQRLSKAKFVEVPRQVIEICQVFQVCFMLFPGGHDPQNSDETFGSTNRGFLGRATVVNPLKLSIRRAHAVFAIIAIRARKMVRQCPHAKWKIFRV